MANKMLQSLQFPGLNDTYLIPLMQDFAPVYDSTATYAVGDYCTHDNKFYVCTTAISTAEAWTVGHWNQVSVAEIATAIGADVDDLKEALSTVETTLTHKADKSGVVASAEQLLSDIGTEDKAPYLFRATQYDSTRVDEEVVGCSVGWNQTHGDVHTTYTSSGVTLTRVDNNTCSISGTSTAAGSVQTSNSTITFKKDHVYLFRKIPGFTGSASVRITLSGLLFSTYDCFMVKRTEEQALYPRIDFASGVEVSVPAFKPQVIDLTAWFGSAIADYAMSLNDATPGTGIDWIEQFLPFVYIPNSAPTLKSVSGLSAHVMRGFNAWDEEVETGSFDNTTGEKTTNANRNRSKNPIPVIPNTAYYVNKVLYRFFYDADMNFISRDASGTNLFTTPSNAQYMNIEQAKADWSGTETCINLSDPARNGQYEPYKATTYALDSDLVLRGILKMDADHRVYADGDVYESDGTVNRTWGIAVIDENTPIMYSSFSSGGQVQYDSRAFQYGEAKYSSGVPPFQCTTYPLYEPGMGNTDTFVSTYRESNIVRFLFRNANFGSTITNATEWKAYLANHPVTIIYELAIPYADTADPFTSPQNCEPGGTEEYVYAEGGSGILVGHNSKYQKNMRSELERVSVAVPEAPGQNGTYSLKATVTSSGVTYGWVAD